MTAPEPTHPAAEHIDANPAVQAIRDGSTIAQFLDGARPMTQASLNIAHALRMRATPAVQEALARSLPADVMLAALVRAGVLTVEDAPIYRAAEHHHWQQRWDGEHTHEGRRYVTRWQVAP